MDSKTNYKNMLLVLLLVVAGLAGAIAPQQAAAKDYGVIIGSKMITSENYTDISASGGFSGVQSGTVTFDPATYTLTLNNATIESPFTNAAGILNRSQKRLHIVLIGNNTIRSKEASAISIVDFGLSITGSGRLTLEVLNGLGRGIDISSGLLQIEGCTINTTREIYVEKGDLIIKNATVNVNLSHGYTAFSVYGLIELEGCSITRPAGARIESFRPGSSSASYRAIGLNGKECTAVTIAPGSTKPELTLDLEELKVEDVGGEHKVILSSIQDFKVNEVTLPSWMSREKVSSGPGAYEYTFKFELNTGPERKADVVFKTTAGDVTLKVTQAAGNVKSPLTLDPKELKVKAEGGAHKVTISSQEEFELYKITEPDWINDKLTSNGWAVRGFRFEFKPNAGPERTANVVFKTNLGNVMLKVTQAGIAKPVFTLEPKELKVSAGGAWYKVYISCNQDFDIKEKETILPSWMNPFVQVAKINSHSYSCLFTTYVNTHGERSGEIVIKTTLGDVKLKVTQEAAAEPEPDEPVFTLDPKELKMEAGGGEKEVTLSYPDYFDVKDVKLPSWISQSQFDYSTLYHGCTFKFKFEPNTGAERTADVVIKTDKGDVKLKVTQAGGSTKPEKAVFTLEPKELKVETDGGKKEVKLSCNQAFELNKVTVPSWMERVPSSATSDEKSRVCAFNIKPNTGAERKADVVIKTDKGNVTLKVTQAGKKEKPEPTLTLSPDMLTFPAGGGKQTVNVKSDYGWDTKASAASASWMKLTTDVKTGKIVVEVTPNTSTKKRGATIQVVSSRRRIGHRTPITRHILVTQEAAKAVEPPVAATGISLNPAAMTMGSGGGTVGFNVYAGKGWTISGSPEWMHPDATRGSGTRLVIVRFDRNESGAERTGKLTVKSDDGKAERTFTLTQRAGQRKPTPSPGSTPSEEYDYDLALNPEEITVGPSDGAGSSISVATSRLWAGSTTEDWIRLESAVGRGNGSFTFRVAANPSKEMRHGTITVRTQQGMDELKVAIHQQGNDGSVVPPAEVKVSNVTLDPATLTVNGDLSTALISAIVSPDNARNKGLLWMSSNASVATVQVSTPTLSAALPQLRFAPDADDYALVTIVGKGKAVITAAASDGSGIVARCEVNVLSTVANTVPYAPQAKVYTVGPTLYLSLPTPETVQVYTLAGTLYRTWQAPAGDTSVTLPVGTYIIKVGPLTEKVVVR